MKRELHIISTGKQSLELLYKNAMLIEPYIDYLHIREKQLLELELFELVNGLYQKGFPSTKLIINGAVAVALATNAHAVQLTNSSLPVKIVKEQFPTIRVGCSVHSLKEAMNKLENGADYIIYGHIFSTKSKQGLPARGTEELRMIVNQVSIPVIAIGGITPSNIDEVLRTGVAGVAVMSTILEANDPEHVVKQYREKLVDWEG